MSVVKALFSRRWLLATVLVVFGVALCVRLGIWQLDRLEQRRAFNARVLAQIDQPELELAGPALDADLYNMEYRPVAVTGEYDFSQQIALRNQVHLNRWGAHLVTPLVLEDGRAVLVDRGWIPAEDFTGGTWDRYDRPGRVTVQGVVRRPQSAPDFGPRSDPTPAPGQAPLKTWTFVNVARLDAQMPYDLLPVYVQQAPGPDPAALPAGSAPDIEITEGPHLGYAVQWFTFAALLGIGYPFFVRRQQNRLAKSGGVEPVDLPVHTS